MGLNVYDFNSTVGLINMALVGYARTSTTDQKAGLESQIRDLDKAGCKEIFSEEISF